MSTTSNRHCSGVRVLALLFKLHSCGPILAALGFLTVIVPRVESRQLGSRLRQLSSRQLSMLAILSALLLEARDRSKLNSSRFISCVPFPGGFMANIATAALSSVDFRLGNRAAEWRATG